MFFHSLISLKEIQGPTLTLAKPQVQVQIG